MMYEYQGQQNGLSQSYAGQGKRTSALEYDSSKWENSIDYDNAVKVIETLFLGLKGGEMVVSTKIISHANSQSHKNVETLLAAISMG